MMKNRVLLAKWLLPIIIFSFAGTFQARIIGNENHKTEDQNLVERDSKKNAKLNESKDEEKFRILSCNLTRGLWKNYKEYSLYVGGGKVISKFKYPYITQCLEVSDSIFWDHYRDLSTFLIATEHCSTNSYHELTIERLDNLAEITCSGSFNRGLYHQLIGIYQSHWLKDYSKARKHFDSSYAILRNWIKSNEDMKIFGLNYNIALNEYSAGNYKRAVLILNKLSSDDNIEQKILNEGLLNISYMRMEEYEVAEYHYKKREFLMEKLNLIKQKELIEKIENSALIKFNQKRWDNKIFRLSSNNELLILICCTVVLGIILLYINSIKINLDRRILRHEKSETIQRIDNLKETVLKNHILFKNNMKIYVANLMYIKSEDHYLLIHTSDSKKHLVRGKLVEIISDLPPNFLQCHRSYIVNSNFITQKSHNRLKLMDNVFIPVSRSHKNKFKT